MMYLGRDNRMGLLGLLACGILLSGCGRGTGGGGKSVPVEPVETTTFFSSTLAGADLLTLPPTASDNYAASGIAQFDSDGYFSHNLSFSDGSEGISTGEYDIAPSGQMSTDLDNGGILPGGVNPEEDFLFLADTVAADDGRLGLVLAASPVNFPAEEIPDFSGTYSLMGVRFLYPEDVPPDVNGNARTVHATMTMIQSELTSGSFVVDGIDSAGDTVLLQGEFALGSDFTLLFSLDDQPGEVWTGSFAPTGLILLSDTSRTNGDAATYAAIPEVIFEGPGPLSFEGDYLVVNLRFYSDSLTPFATGLEGMIRTFYLDGTFEDRCDAQYVCAGGVADMPYVLNVDGTLSVADPFSAFDFLGAVTSDLGTFVAVKVDGDLGGGIQESPILIGIRLL